MESDDPGDSTSFLVDVALHGDIQIVLKHKGLIRNRFGCALLSLPLGSGVSLF